MCVCVCVCVKERERGGGERERHTERERERERERREAHCCGEESCQAVPRTTRGSLNRVFQRTEFPREVHGPKQTNQ